MGQGFDSWSLWIRTSIFVGAALFIFALAGSAALIPQLRLLHLLQAFICVAILLFVRRDSSWVYGAGVFIAMVWNGFVLFVTHLTQAGAEQFLSLMHGGHVSRPDTLMVFIGSVDHFILLAGCIGGVVRLKPQRKQWLHFFGGGFFALAYFGLIVFILAPH
jgi:hypothetical protein